MQQSYGLFAIAKLLVIVAKSVANVERNSSSFIICFSCCARERCIAHFGTKDKAICTASGKSCAGCASRPSSFKLLQFYFRRLVAARPETFCSYFTGDVPMREGNAAGADN